MFFFVSVPDSSEHLVVILRELQELVEWQQLGMELGLSYATLQGIAVSNHSNLKACKMEMMEAWLQGRDNAHGQGGITKKALVDALERADLKSLALKLDPTRKKSS